MNFWKNKFLVLILVTIFDNLDRSCAQNAIKMLTIPLISTSYVGPKKFERIIVPVYPTLPYPRDEENEEKPVTEKVIDVESSTELFRVSSQKPKTVEDGKGNYQKPYSYASRTDGYPRKSLNKFNESNSKVEHRSYKHEPIKIVQESKPDEKKVYVPPNKMQPLHIKTKEFEKTSPDHSKESREEKIKKFTEQEEKLKIKNLPKNPTKVPETNWFDNRQGKYNYGIVHDSAHIEDLQSLEDATENESKESIKETKPVIPVPVTQQPSIPVKIPHVAKFHHPIDPPKHHNPPKFNHPIDQTKFHQENDNAGKFLYKSEVYYPNYRDHLYLPFTTYYGDANIFPKTLPIYSTHAVIHTPQPFHHNHPKPIELPVKVPIPIPKGPPTIQSTKPVTFHSPVVPKAEVPAQKQPIPPKKPAERKSQPSEEEEDEEYDEDEDEDEEENGDENDNGKTQNYDYQEGDSLEDDDGSSDKQQAESSEDYTEEDEDDEEEEEEKPKYSYSSFKNKNDESSREVDDFDKAWRKYGYRSSESSEENESSESRIVTQEVEPERKKIVHMKMEYYRLPYDEQDSVDSESKTTITEVEKPQRKMNSKRSGTINNNEKEKKKKKSKKTSVKSQQQHPNAGPDDLKFFQYFNYLGNGEHRAGGRVGNDKHYVEQHERGSEVAGAFQKKVKWADKDGGFGEHYWDLNHGK